MQLRLVLCIIILAFWRSSCQLICLESMTDDKDMRTEESNSLTKGYHVAGY